MPGPVNTNCVPGSTNTNLVPGPVNTNWGQGTVNTNLEPGPGARTRAGGQAKDRGPGNTNDFKFTVKENCGYIFYLPGKIPRKQLYNLTCCKTMQLEIGGLATETCFVHCLQPVVHYFKGKSVYF